MSERNAFIAWARSHGYSDTSLGRTPSDGFTGSYVEAAWEAWKASRRAALEEAAKVCDGPFPGLSGMHSWTCAILGSKIRRLAQGGE